MSLGTSDRLIREIGEEKTRDKRQEKQERRSKTFYLTNFTPEKTINQNSLSRLN
jgi:hypothetical protein